MYKIIMLQKSLFASAYPARIKSEVFIKVRPEPTRKAQNNFNSGEVLFQ